MDPAVRIERREFKYFLDPERVRALRSAIAPFTERDKHAQRSPTGTYAIESLYFDSPHLTLFRENEKEAFHRVKLRIRRYPESGNSPYFFEVKARSGDVIHKSRHAVQESRWKDLLVGDGDGSTTGVSPSSTTYPPATLARFLTLHQRYCAEPKVLVRYEREPYESTIDDYVRITFDRRMEAYAVDELGFDKLELGYPLDASHDIQEVRSLTLVELKFTQNVPLWLSNIVRNLGLGRASCSKYARALVATRQVPSIRSRRGGAL